MKTLYEYMEESYNNSVVKGFWQGGDKRNKAEMIALMHSELSEMLEGVRKPGPDSHYPDFTSEAVVDHKRKYKTLRVNASRIDQRKFFPQKNFIE